MKLGTKSILFGVHQFIWHPLTVAMAWRQIEGRCPKWWELVAIFCHDLGYIGCPDMDGEEGRKHPLKGAQITADVVQWLYCTGVRLRHPVQARYNEAFAFHHFIAANLLRSKAYKLALGHSRFYAEQEKIPLSRLFRPDKLSVRFDPPWFYVLRASLSGEIDEYISKSKTPCASPWEWYGYYRAYVNAKWGGRCV